MRAVRERDRVLEAVDRVGEDHAAEEHHLGGEEHPHPELGDEPLLLRVVELLRDVLDGSGVISQGAPPGRGSRTAAA